MKRWTIYALLFIVTTNTSQLFSNESLSAVESRAQKVLIFGIDGVRPDALRMAKTPFMDALARDGVVAENTQILGERYKRNDTVSGPGWASILTGVWADKHRVHDNTFRRANFRAYPHFLKLLKTVKPGAVTASFVSWKPLADHVIQTADKFVIRSPAESPNARQYAETEQRLAEEARQFIQEQPVDAAFVYFSLADSMGHTKGFHPKVPEYVAAIQYIDRFVGIVLRGMLSRKTYAKEDWLVIICTDHGGRGKDHSKGHRVPEIRNVFLIVSGLSAARGKIREKTYIVDVAATALTHLGVTLNPAWKLDGKAVGLKEASGVLK